MKGKNEGYLLLEAMLAMVVISVSILFMVTSIMFLLTEEKKVPRGVGDGYCYLRDGLFCA